MYHHHLQAAVNIRTQSSEKFFDISSTNILHKAEKNK
jgi:hypothetical protein